MASEAQKTKSNQLVIFPKTTLSPFSRPNRTLSPFNKSGLFITQLTPQDPDKLRIQKLHQRFMNTFTAAGTGMLLAVLVAPILPAVNLLAIVLLLYSVRISAQNAWNALRKGKPSAYQLTIVAFMMVLLGGNLVMAGALSFIASSALILTMRVKGETTDQIVDMFRQQARFVWLVTEEGERLSIPISAIKVGQVVAVDTGQIIPVDGSIIIGHASIDQQMLTGESQPSEKGVGEAVYASTSVLAGQIFVRVEKTGNETTISQIGQILNKTLDAKANAQLWAEEIIDKSVIPSLLIGAALLPTFGYTAATAFLFAHPKMKMPMLAGTAALGSFYILSDQGILVKDARALDFLRSVDTVVFDKTGTLTLNKMYVADIHTTVDMDPMTVLAYAAAAEVGQPHPIAHAIVEAAQQSGVPLPTVLSAKYEIGYGLDVQTENYHVRVGSYRFMEIEQIALPALIEDALARASEIGHSLVMVALDEVLVGALEMVPLVRPEAQSVIEQLHALGIQHTYIISGDQEGPTRKLAHELGIDHYFANTLPQEKAQLIEQLVEEGRIVCYVGDGINDSIALGKAQVSVSLAGASTVAKDTARVVLMSDSIEKLPALFKYGKQYVDTTRRTLIYLSIVSGGAMVLSLAPYGLGIAMASYILGLVGGLAVALEPAWTYSREKTEAELASGEKLRRVLLTNKNN